MTTSIASAQSLAEFLRLPETKPASEYINGEIFQKPMPKGKHSALQTRLATTLNAALNPDRVAWAFSGLRCTFGDLSMQSQTRATKNILHCLQYGTQLGWFIDRKIQAILVYSLTEQVKIFDRPERLFEKPSGVASATWPIPDRQ